MGLFGKIKNILFEEEEIEVPAKDIRSNEKAANVVEEKAEIKEESFDKARQVMSEDSKDLFEKEPSFNFPDFDEDEFENTLPRFKEPKKEEAREPRIFNDYPEEPKKTIAEERSKREEIYNKKPETKSYKPISLFSGTKKVEEAPKRFTPSPIISPVYGILDKDYHPSEIKSKGEDLTAKRISKLDVDSVRKKAFEPEVKKEVKVEVKEEVKEEPKEEILPPEKELKKSLDELLADSATETVAIDEDLTVENNIKEIEDELDKIDDDIVLDDKSKEPDDDDTLEQDLFELIDSMYEDKKEDEE